MRYDFIRRAWWMVAVWPVVAGAIAPAVLFAPRWMRGFALGGVAVSGLWGAAYMVATMSGASSALLGQLSEQWTARELRRLRRRGWRLINQVHFRTWDIDHVLLGPGGAVVVETKFSADGWAPSRYTNWVISNAQDRARQNAEDIRLNLGKSILLPPLVTSVVVLWGRSDVETIDRQENGVHILSGHLFRGWLDGISDTGLDNETVSTLYDRLASQVQERDRQDVERSGALPKPLSSSLIILCGATVLGLAACWAELESLHLIGWRWVPLIGTAFVAVQWPFRRYAASRPWRLAWLAGSQTATALIGLAYLVFFVRQVV
jgi:hypothetical protein